MKFNIGIFTENLFKKRDFRENQRSDGRTFCSDVNQTLPNFTSDFQIGKCNVDSSLQTDPGSREIWPNDSRRLLKGVNDFLLVLRLLRDATEFPYTRCEFHGHREGLNFLAYVD